MKKLNMPPVTETEDGNPRRIGIEIEFTGLGIEAIGRACREHLGGSINPISPYEYDIEDTKWGNFHIELDYRYLKNLGRKATGIKNIPENLEQFTEDMLASVAKRLVPFEIVTPPMPMKDIAKLLPLIEALRKAGAQGTHKSPVYAFGLHMNPELPNLKARTLTAYMKAFMCLYDWLKRESDIDISRRMTPYIQHYPVDYITKVVDPKYWPNRQTLIDDYLEANPSRNRALDMLPVFTHIDKKRVRDVVGPDHKINPRPTLHYRMPNCDIDREDWNLDDAWHDWLKVEQLAADRDQLNAACADFSKYLRYPMGDVIRDWQQTVKEWWDRIE